MLQDMLNEHGGGGHNYHVLNATIGGSPVERWIGDKGSDLYERTFGAMVRMGEARNAEEFIEGIRLFNNPHQNVVFADTAGAWGYWMGGRVPIRASGIPPQLPVPGWTGSTTG